MTCCEANETPNLNRQPPGNIQDKIKEDEIRAVQLTVAHDKVQSIFVVPDMHCIGCITAIERGLSALPQVHDVRANLSTRRVTVTWHPDQGRAVDLSDTLSNLGFKHSVLLPDTDTAGEVSTKGKQLLLALAVAGFAAANIMLLSISVWSGADAETAKLFHLISGLIAVPAVAIAGRPFFLSAFAALRVGRLNMDVPISLAVLLALGMGLFESLNGGEEAYFDACVMLLFFLLIGRYLDHLMREKANGSIASLTRMMSKGGVVVRSDGSADTIPQSEITNGMTLRVLPGERFPVDGRIMKGTTDIDRSLVTGESASVASGPEDRLEAGVLNLTGSIDIIATSTSENSFLADVLSMMEAAQNGRGHYVRLAEKMATIYAPAVHILALTTFIGWMVFAGGDIKTSLYAAIAVLIITCPCALGLAVPVVHVVGANRLFAKGILMRDGSALERLSEVDTIVFDKTGTLTSGEPHLVEVGKANPQTSAVIATLAAHSSHPTAQALRQHFTAPPLCPLDHLREIPGYGVEATLEARKVRLGRPSWVLELSKDTTGPGNDASSSFCREGDEPVYFELSDTLRPDAIESLNLLRKRGLDVEIMSGDRRQAVTEAARHLQVAKFDFEMSPHDKIERLVRLESSGHKMLMVGDGLNDAPALSAAHVSMAPASASEIGRLAADYIYTRDELAAIPFAYEVARRSTRLIKQNFAIAVAYNCIAVPLAITGQVTPLIAAIAMSLSSIVVVANSMRLNWMNAEPMAPQVESDAIPHDDNPDETGKYSTIKPHLAAS